MQIDDQEGRKEEKVGVKKVAEERLLPHMFFDVLEVDDWGLLNEMLMVVEVGGQRVIYLMEDGWRRCVR